MSTTKRSITLNLNTVEHRALLFALDYILKDVGKYPNFTTQALESTRKQLKDLAQT